MDVVSTALAGVAPPGVPDVQGHLARPLDHQGAKSREEGQGKIKGRSMVSAPRSVCTWGYRHTPEMPTVPRRFASD
jgi:hypothetical protein